MHGQPGIMAHQLNGDENKHGTSTKEYEPAANEPIGT